MHNLTKQLERLVADEGGQDLIEYALVAALIGLGAVATLKGLTNSIGNVFNDLGNTYTGASS